MHNNEKKQKFIELRVKGESLGSIAKTLDVPRTTLWHWDKEEAERINELQLMEQDEAESIWLAEREERLGDLQMNTMTIHRVLVEKIETRAEHLPIKELFLYLNLLRSEMEHYRIKPLQRDKTQATSKPIPVDDPAPSQEPHATIIPLPTSASAPAATGKMVQNGTTSPENGTAPKVESKSTTPPASPEAHNSNMTGPSPAAAQPGTKAEMVQNGTNPRQNGTAASLAKASATEAQRPTNQTSLPNPVISESLTKVLETQQTTGREASSNPPMTGRSTNQEMVQNGTNSGQNGTAPETAINGTARGPEAAAFSVASEQSGSAPKENQLPPKPTPPPERMIGHEIDPTKIVGRNTPPPAR